MKREIKRLQRLRDMFRQNVSNPAIVDQHRLVEARKRIETVSLKSRIATPFNNLLYIQSLPDQDVVEIRLNI